jgi:hypothetical protein
MNHESGCRIVSKIQVELLDPVLDQGKKQRYHDHLVSKSLLPMFGIQLPAHSQQ